MIDRSVQQQQTLPSPSAIFLFTNSFLFPFLATRSLSLSPTAVTMLFFPILLLLLVRISPSTLITSITHRIVSQQQMNRYKYVNYLL